MAKQSTPKDVTDLALSDREAELLKLVNKLRLLYQPIIRLRDMHPTAVEVLTRVMGSDQILAGPEPLLEAMNSPAASMLLSREILRRGLTEQAGLGIGNRNDLCFTFNLPLDAMLDASLLGMIEAVRDDLLPARLLGFELTERHPVANIAELGEIITRLLDAGYMVSLDDVTPETPNLEALMELPLRTIKLDRSVVTEATAAGEAFIRQVVAGAERRDQNVVAEGIETAAASHRMQALGVTHGQGFLFAAPLAVAALQEFLSGWTYRETA